METKRDLVTRVADLPLHPQMADHRFDVSGNPVLFKNRNREAMQLH